MSFIDNTFKVYFFTLVAVFLLSNTRYSPSRCSSKGLFINISIVYIYIRVLRVLWSVMVISFFKLVVLSWSLKIKKWPHELGQLVIRNWNLVIEKKYYRIWSGKAGTGHDKKLNFPKTTWPKILKRLRRWFCWSGINFFSCDSFKYRKDNNNRDYVSF